jgi:hypothetical protein
MFSLFNLKSRTTCFVSNVEAVTFSIDPNDANIQLRKAGEPSSLTTQLYNLPDSLEKLIKVLQANERIP